MSYHNIGSARDYLGAQLPVAPPTPAEIGAAGGTAFDPATMTLYVGGGKVPIIPALLSAIIVKTLMFGGAKAGGYARAKLFGKPAMANPGIGGSKLLPLAIVAGGAYLLFRKPAAPVAGVGDLGFSISSVFNSITSPISNVVHKLPVATLVKPLQKVVAPVFKIASPIQKITGGSSGGSAPAAPIPAPAMTYLDANGSPISQVQYNQMLTQVSPAQKINPAVLYQTTQPAPAVPQPVVQWVQTPWAQLSQQIQKLPVTMQTMRVPAKQAPASASNQDLTTSWFQNVQNLQTAQINQLISYAIAHPIIR